MVAHVSVQGKVKQSKHCDHHRKRKIITNKYKTIKTKNVNKVYVDGSHSCRGVIDVIWEAGLLLCYLGVRRPGQRRCKGGGVVKRC